MFLPGVFFDEKFRMKGFLCCAILLLVCVFVQVQGNCEYTNGEILPVGTHYRDCQQIKCNEDGSMSMLGCPLSLCTPGNQIGYHELDVSKPYPECCERPICKTD
ncbi:uncharacterized protein LOC116845477 [Odontomachus brunneus]|uniref:uncharacterized protein LOC116845477 n=1 Tax=Odontomachus brunneus TaxID=486640 RepID=UPI0013F1BCC1|nr:uncharacterized protein LOC116845477 [Odontomachus brunneus]